MFGKIFAGLIGSIWWLFAIGGAIVCICEGIAKSKEQRKKAAENRIIEKELQKAKGKRIMCLQCKYCKTKLEKPFYTSMTLAHYLPSYCYKFKIRFPRTTNTISMTCQATDPYKAERDGVPVNPTNNE